MVASSAAWPRTCLDGLVAMQMSLVPSTASVRLLPVMAEQPLSGLALVAGHGCIAEVHAAGSLQQVAGGRRQVAKLRRCARQQGLREHRIIALHLRVVREIRIPDGGADLQPAIRQLLDLVETAGG